MSPQNLLSFLSSGLDYLDSEILIGRISELFARSSKVYEEEIKISPKLSKLLEQLEPEDHLYLARSPKARSLLGEVNKEISMWPFANESKYLQMADIIASVLNKKNIPPADENIGSGMVIGQYPYLSETWSTLLANDLSKDGEFIDSMFQAKFSLYVSIYDCKLSHPTNDILNTLLSVLSNIFTISPHVGRDIILNVRFLCFIIFTSEREYVPRTITRSFTASDMPMTSFFSPLTFLSYESAFEGIYHEALHSKFINMYTSYSTFHHNHAELAQAIFPCPWPSTNIGGATQDWPFARALNAYHVYVHLVILYNVILHEKPPVRLDMAWVRQRLEEILGKIRILQPWLDEQVPIVLTPFGNTFYQTLRTCFTEASKHSELILRGSKSI